MRTVHCKKEKKEKKKAHDNEQKANTHKQRCIHKHTHDACPPTECNLLFKSAAGRTVPAEEDWLQSIMSPQEVVSLYLSPLLRRTDQSAELDLVR